MRILTAAEARTEIGKLPVELRGTVATIAYSMWDEGVSAGLVNTARGLNPMRSLLPPPSEQAASPKGKAR